MEVKLLHTHSSVAGLHGLLLELLMHKSLSKTRVVRRMENLETGHDLGAVWLGPWPKKNVSTNHGNINDAKDITTYHTRLTKLDRFLGTLLVSVGRF